ncbi:hypothetical protein K7X08_010155 [Anisodus acutangulus]|uniref:Myricetin 7/4'-O-methyltransferase 2 n=1 Tax=Anisodus acutangulus TaxID=402998 RepID=A0A9Q1N0T4_9SOLA|nr:hypothetical protein K7X08_010155 [Anisodus acutangulus]
MSTSESTSAELLGAQAQIWNYIFNFISSSAVKCALQLGILDVLYKHDKPMCLSDLSVELSVVNSSKVSFLPILMRFLVHSGFLNQHEDHYFLTPASRLLAKNEPFNVRSLLLVNHDPVLSKAWLELSAWFQNDSPTAFHTAHGKSFWDYLEGEPSVLGDILNDALASDSRFNTNVLIIECKHMFEGLTSLVDVGGGTGTVSIAIAKAFPNIKCTVLDLPHVVRDCKGSWNLDFVGGDMFDKIPHANAMLLKHVLHNWRDEDCVKILKICKESIPNREKGGKVIIIDTVMEGDSKQSDEFVRAQHNMGMLMMVLLAAKERTEKEWEKLFIEAGFTEYKIIPALGLSSLIEIYP